MGVYLEKNNDRLYHLVKTLPFLNMESAIMPRDCPPELSISRGFWK
jgi:hypothetical protein